METVEFKYCFKDDDDDNDSKQVCVMKRNENGVLDEDICEMFLDFMSSAGYSLENVFNFFRE